MVFGMISVFSEFERAVIRDRVLARIVLRQPKALGSDARLAVQGCSFQVYVKSTNLRDTLAVSAGLSFAIKYSTSCRSQTLTRHL